MKWLPLKLGDAVAESVVEVADLTFVQSVLKRVLLQMEH